MKQLSDAAKKSDALTLMKDAKTNPSFKYIMIEAEEINQIATTVNMIRLFVTVLRYVLGFLTDMYLSNAKLAIVKAEAVLEMRKFVLSAVASPTLGFISRHILKWKLAFIGFVIAPAIRSAAAKFTINQLNGLRRFLLGSKTTARIMRMLPTMLVRDRIREMTVVVTARDSGASVNRHFK